MDALGAAGEALGMQHAIHLGGARAFGAAARPVTRERDRILPAAFEARAVAGGERRHLVEEKELRVAASPHRAVTIIETEPAADPRLRGPPSRGEPAIIVMQPAAAIAHEQAARRVGEQFAEGGHAVLQSHGLAASGRRERNPV